jgi:fermentation-respiration switch protein FrsA (DUF1100 family)
LTVLNALHYTLIGAGAAAAAVAVGAGIAAPYIHKLFQKSFGRSQASVDGQNAFLEGLRSHGFEKQVEIVKSGWATLASTEHEKVYITSHDGHKLCAKLYAPPSPSATVILVHGYHSKSEMDFGCVFAFYAARGIAMLMVDQRAHGESEGAYLTFGAKEQYDIRDWAKYLVKRYGEQHSIILDGVSMGCATVLLASALPDLPAQVKAIIGDCGYSSAKSQIKQVIKEDMHLPAGLVYPVTSLLCKLYGGAYLGEADVEGAMKHAKLPTLFAHGGGDDFVRPYHSERCYAACASSYKRLCIFEGSPHGLSYLDHKEEYEKEIIALLRHAGVLD